MANVVRYLPSSGPSRARGPQQGPSLRLELPSLSPRAAARRQASGHLPRRAGWTTRAGFQSSLRRSLVPESLPGDPPAAPEPQLSVHRDPAAAAVGSPRDAGPQIGSGSAFLVPCWERLSQMVLSRLTVKHDLGRARYQLPSQA